MNIEHIFQHHEYDKIPKMHKYLRYFVNGDVISVDEKDENIRLCLLCNWTTNLHDMWKNMIPPDLNITLTNDDPDYWVIINNPIPGSYYDPKRTIIFQMEPNMSSEKYKWGEFSSPDETKFLKVFTHENSHNNIEWHLSFPYDKLFNMIIKKHYNNEISAIVSGKYFDEGHIKRIDFIKFIENTIPIHVYGDNTFNYKNYKGSLPPHMKEMGLFPYKYHFNAENNSIPNYFTEKIIDGILSECLVFYWGCPNIGEYIDYRAFIILDLNDLVGSMHTVINAIKNDEWSRRINIIREEKKKIMRDMNMFRRIYNHLNYSINHSQC